MNLNQQRMASFYFEEDNKAYTLDKTEHVPPLKTVKSVQFWS